MSRRGFIALSDQPKQHPLFPLLDYIARSEYHQIESISEVKRETKDIQKDVDEIKELQKELHGLIEKVSKETFDLDKSGYKV